VLVDGAPSDEIETQTAVEEIIDSLPYRCDFVRNGGGTAIQRNVGIDIALGDFVAFVDDDVRLEPDFFQKILEAFESDPDGKVGGVVGYRTNEYFAPETAQRWRWYRRLRLLKVYEPGRYDFECGYPINANMQPPFTGVREVDFATTSCVVWRREVLDGGLRFDPFFIDYGVLEDAHFSLRASRRWKLLQCGDACCRHLVSSNGRANRRTIGYKCVVNYYYVFRDVAGPLSVRQKFRFWRFQAFEFFRIASSAVRRRRLDDLRELQGRLEGLSSVATERLSH
jgi:GT2 family glycosyltransferase